MTALPLAHPAAPQGEIERLHEALVDAREIILELIHARDCEYEGTDEEMIGFIDAALAPAAIASGREGAE